MKIEVVARNAGEVNRFLRKVCLARGRVMMCLDRKVRRWHYDILPLNADRGDVWNVYKVCLVDDCQGHLTEWERAGVTTLEAGCQYLTPRTAEMVPCRT